MKPKDTVKLLLFLFALFLVVLFIKFRKTSSPEVSETPENKTEILVPLSPTPTATPQGQGAAKTDISAPMAAFESKLQATLEQLPKQEPLANATDEDVHQMPASVMKALEPFTDIVQEVADNPKLEPSAFEFYKKCATDDGLNLLVTLRSRCLSKARVLAPKLDRQREVDEMKSWLKTRNPEIVRLSDAVPD